MRTAEPIFKDGALEKLLCPPPKEPSRRDRNSAQDGALVPSNGPEFYSSDPSMQQQMQHQGRSIDQISNSVNHLQDTMADLKHSFTALRIELNGPSRYMGENGPVNGQGFDMITTVLLRALVIRCATSSAIAGVINDWPDFDEHSNSTT